MKFRRRQPTERVALTQEEFDAAKCAHCGGVHLRACARVRRMKFDERGNLMEVEFWASWPDDNVLWPEQIYDGSTDGENE